MNGIVPGSPQDPSRWFLAWLRNAIGEGTIDQTEWYQQIVRLWQSLCGMDREAWNASVTAIRTYMADAGLAIPADFPAPISDDEFRSARMALSCPSVGSEGLISGLTPGIRIGLSLGLLAVGSLVGLAIYAVVKWQAKPRAKRKARRTLR